MIINCENCGTRFRLPEEKLRPGGIKVRCAKCKQIFTATPPAPEPASVEEEIFFGGLEPSASPPQEEESDTDDFDFGLVSGPGERTDENDEDSEFSFAGLDLDSQQEEEDFGLGARAETPDEELSRFGELSFDEAEEDTVEPSEGSADFEPPPSASTGAKDSFDFGELSFDEEEEPAEKEEDGFVLGTPDEADFSSQEPPSEDETASEGFAFTETREEEEEEEEEEEDFAPLSFEEQPEKMDTGSAFGEEKSFEDEIAKDRLQDFTFSGQEEEDEFTWEEEPPSEETQEGSRKMHGDPFAVAEEPADQAFGRDEGPEEDLVPGAAQEPATFHERAADQGTAPGLDEKSAPITPPAPRRSPVASMMVFFLIVLLVLTAVTGYLFWTEGPKAFENILSQVTGEASRTPAAPVDRIKVTDQSGRFVVNRHAGELFVINGQVVNRYPEARSAIQVKGIVYNQQGRPVLQQTVFCGNPMDEETLRSLPFARIEERMNNQFGDNLSNLNVAPDGSIPFTVVFRNLPEKMAEFTIEVVDSRPAAK